MDCSFRNLQPKPVGLSLLEIDAQTWGGRVLQPELEQQALQTALVYKGKTLAALWPLSTEQAGREPGMDTFPWKTVLTAGVSLA